MNRKVRNSNYHLLTAILLILVSCKEGKSEKGGINSTTKDQIFAFNIGDVLIKAKLAILTEERQKGLMFVDEMDPGTGMLFVFEEPTPQKFWMKNTRIPLDIGYFSSNGTLKEIHSAKPYDLSGVPSRSKNIQFVLELNLNDFRTQKIKIGDRLNLGDIREAIKARGLNPEKYKL